MGCRRRTHHRKVVHVNTEPRPAPDDSTADQTIAEATYLEEALFEIAEKYQTPVTNNEPRWKDGVYLREVGDFIGDILDAVKRFT